VTFDEQIGQALDKVLSSLRTHLDTDLRAFTHELVRAALEERTRAASQAAEAAAAEVRRQAEGQFAQLREAAQGQAAELRRTAEAQLHELRTVFQRQLDEVKRAAHEKVEEANRVAHAQIESSRQLATVEIDDARRVAATQVDDVQRLMDERLAQTRGELEARLADVRREAEAQVQAVRADSESIRREESRVAEEIIIERLAEAQAAAARDLDDSVARARGDAQRAEVAHTARLADAIRTLDRGRSLGDVLDTLGQSAGREVDRAAVLILRGEALRGWRLTNFAVDSEARALTLSFDAAGVLGTVVRTGRPAAGLFTPAGGPDGAVLPAFARSETSRHALAFPITVGGQVVAVLYGDSPALEATSTTARWPAILEMLGRHSSRVLEAMTVRQAAALGTPTALAPPSMG